MATYRRPERLAPQPAQPIQIFTHVPSPSELSERAQLLAELSDTRERVARLEALVSTLPAGWVGATIEATLRQHGAEIANNTRRLNLMARHRRAAAV